MAKASSRSTVDLALSLVWQEATAILSRSWSLTLVALQSRQWTAATLRLGKRRWLFLLLILVLLAWNWQLWLAIAAGFGMMKLVYQIQRQRLTLPWARLHQFYRRLPDHPELLAVSSGAIATLTLYLTTAIWQEAHSSVIALAIMLQGMGILAILLLLSWFILQQHHQQQNSQFQALILELTQTETLRRLIAVRQLSLFARKGLNPEQNQLLVDCFSLLLTQEPEPQIRHALLTSLEILQSTPLPQSSLGSF